MLLTPGVCNAVSNKSMYFQGRCGWEKWQVCDLVCLSVGRERVYFFLELSDMLSPSLGLTGLLNLLPQSCLLGPSSSSTSLSFLPTRLRMPWGQESYLSISVFPISSTEPCPQGCSIHTRKTSKKCILLEKACLPISCGLKLCNCYSVESLCYNKWDHPLDVCKGQGYYFGKEVLYVLDFPGGSNGRESACNAGDPSSISGSGRSPGEGNGKWL